MTVRVERTVELAATPEDVWEFIADPTQRARAISVVDDYEIDGDEAVWQIRLPVPLVDQTVAVHTRDVERDPPHRVKFVGRSSAFRVSGEHDIERTGEGTRLTNRFVVEGRVPGVERFFRRNLDDELDNLEAALREALE